MTDRIPILIFCDAISGPSGLARIARDLSTRLHANLGHIFDVGTVGQGGCGSRKFGFQQYAWQQNEEFIIHDLPELWQDFAQGRPGIFLSIQDPGRVMWLAQPDTDMCSDRRVADFLKHPPFKKWGYFAIDAKGPNDKFSFILQHCFLGYNRVLCYSQWAEKIVMNTIGIAESDQRDLQWRPHGIDTSVFYPRGRKWRQVFGGLAAGVKASIADDELLIGIVATNQFRKDFGLGIQVCALLAKTHKIRIWIHTDSLDRHWSIPYLLQDFGLNTKQVQPLISWKHIDDDAMAKLYSACDVTLGIGNAEGFGYCLFESLACGTPCIHGNYGGGAEHIPKHLLVEPVASRIHGALNNVRMVYRPEDWVARIEDALAHRREYSLPPHLDWKTLWPSWESWFLHGISKKDRDTLSVVGKGSATGDGKLHSVAL